MKLNLSVFPVAPSSPYDPSGAGKGVDLLRTLGFRLSREPSLRTFWPSYLNGSDALRLAELEEAFSSQADIMWMARGGYGLTRITPALGLPSGKVPTLVGFSDTTALHCHLWRHKRQKGIHGPNLARLADEDSASLNVLWSILSGEASSIRWPQLNRVSWQHQDDVTGPLIVANLCVLTHLIGTPSMPDLSGTILAIEEIAERPYRIDRMLTQLWHAGSLNGVRAIVMGQFTSCEEKADDTLSARSIISERCKTFGIPLCEGLPVGHATPNWSIPFGAQATLKTIGDSVKLQILEELF